MVIMPVYASVGKGGGVASQIHLSTMEGVKILENGGNAFDAAITISSLLTVLLPNLGSIGGDGFLLALNSGDELIAYNGSGRSSQDFPVEKYLRQKPIKGSLTITVPGLVDLWEWTNMNFGSRDLGSLLNKAISLARNGFCAQESLSQAIETVRSILANSETWKETFGSTEIGSKIIFPKLSEIYEAIGKRGSDAFYRSKLTEEIDSTEETEDSNEEEKPDEESADEPEMSTEEVAIEEQEETPDEVEEVEMSVEVEGAVEDKEESIGEYAEEQADEEEKSAHIETDIEPNESELREDD